MAVKYNAEADKNFSLIREKLASEVQYRAEVPNGFLARERTGLRDAFFPRRYLREWTSSSDEAMMLNAVTLSRKYKSPPLQVLLLTGAERDNGRSVNFYV